MPQEGPLRSRLSGGRRRGGNALLWLSSPKQTATGGRLGNSAPTSDTILPGREVPREWGTLALG